MILVITKEVWHRTNNQFPCLLVQFEEKDRHYFKRDMNWMPKEDEIEKIVESFCSIYPDFWERLKKRVEGDYG